MEDTDFAVAVLATSSAGFVLAATFLNFLQNAIQVIGVGTAISLGLGIYKFYLDRKENKQRKALEFIRRLQPLVYNPLLKWAVASRKALDNIPQDEIIYVGVASPPDLSEEGDYLALVGNALRTQVEHILSSYHLFNNFNSKVYDEYRDRLASILKTLNPQWRLGSLIVELDRKDGSHQNVNPGSHRIHSIREWLQDSNRIVLNHNSQPTGTIDCPDEMLTALTVVQNLPSFNDFMRARQKLRDELKPFISTVEQIIRQGEKDWNL